MKKKKNTFKQIFDPEYLKGSDHEKAVIAGGNKFRENKVFKFTWDYCAQCQTMMVRCPMCGNNCCNAGFGMVTKDMKPAHHGDKKAKTCPVCNLAYQFQHLAWKTKEAPEATKKQIKEEGKKLAKAWESLGI